MKTPAVWSLRGCDDALDVGMPVASASFDNVNGAGQLMSATELDEEIAARRAVAGVDADIIEAGGTPEEADAIAIAFRRYLVGDREGARKALGDVFSSEMATLLLARFGASAHDC